MKYSTACHEAAHYIALFQEGFNPTSLSIKANSTSAGRVRFPKASVTRLEDAESMLYCIYAGPFAERKAEGLPSEFDEGATDNWEALQILGKFNYSDRKDLHKKALDRAEDLIKTDWESIDLLAKKLIEKEEMESREVNLLIR